MTPAAEGTANAADRLIELRCPRHLHGKVIAAAIEVKCQQCSKATGTEVKHRYGIRLTADGPLVVPLPDHVAGRSTDPPVSVLVVEWGQSS